MDVTNDTLAKNILRTVAYFDLFDYPLTAKQIFQFLPQNSVSTDDVYSAVERLVKSNTLCTERGYFYLLSSEKNIVQQRVENERRAKRKLAVARFVAAFIKRFPYVRAVFLTGSLSKHVSPSASDIDFMIVTAEGRLWICRTLLTLFRRIFLFGSRKFFCTNYYVTENGYLHPKRNIYTALEVVTTKAIWNESAFMKFQLINNWTKEFLPNCAPASERELLISSSRSLLQRFFELLLEFFPLHRLESQLMEMHRRHWRQAFNDVSSEQFKSMFVISPDVSACWSNEHQEPVLVQYHQKLLLLGLE